ncbi:MAG: S1C family serine protease [Verrucomicrobiales bacterium]
MKQRSLTVIIASAMLTGFIPCVGTAKAIEAPASLRERQEKIQKVAREVAPAVVAITPGVVKPSGSNQNPRQRGGWGVGSGVIVSSDGLILTAAHVLHAVGDEFTVIFSDGRQAQAKALGKYLSRDAALAQITTKGEFPHADRAEPEAAVEGEWCLALGHPGGYEIDRPAPVRLGRIVSKDDGGFIVTDCTLSGGDSGGPLFNLEGKLVGIHSSIGWRLAENRHVPMAAFKNNWERLMKEGETWGKLGLAGRRGGDPGDEAERAPWSGPEPEQPVLGVEVDRQADEVGALVARVAPDSPARKAGVKAGDVIEKVNDQEITDQEDLVNTIRKLKAGDKISLGVKREGEQVKLEATLVAAKDLSRE